MSEVYLLKSHQCHNAGEIITVSNNVAFGLVETGKARNVKTEDFLVKPQHTFGVEIKTRAFKRAPRRKIKNKTYGRI